MVKIYKGDDTDFANLSEIVINIKTAIDLTGYTGRFYFLGIDKDFTTAQIASKSVTVSYTAEETETFCPGMSYGTFHLYDVQGRHAAVMKVQVQVVLHSAVVGRQEVEIEIENVYDYNKLGNIPTIDGVEVKGSKDAHDFGIAKLTDIAASSQSNWNETDSSKPSFVQNKPKLGGVDITGDKTPAQYGLATATQLNGKVDKVAGKGLSTHDLTDTLNTKLTGLSGFVSTDGFMFVPAGKSGAVQLYRKLSFQNEEGMGWVLVTSDSVYTRNDATGEFTEV